MSKGNPWERVRGLTEDSIEHRVVNAVVIQGYDSPEYAKHQAEIEKIKERGEFLNYDIALKDWRCFSSIDERDKYTQRLADCTGVVIFGKRKDSNEIVSCISHSDEINPLSERINLVNMARMKTVKDRFRVELDETILDLRTQLTGVGSDEEIEVYDDELDMDIVTNKKEYLEKEIKRVQGEIDHLSQNLTETSFLEFDDEVHKKMSEFKAIVDPATVTASVFGGQTLEVDRTSGKGGDIEIGDEVENKKAHDAYTLAVRLWEEYIITHFGFEPSVAHEPLTIRGNRHGTDMYVDTQARKIFIVHKTSQVG